MCICYIYYIVIHTHTKNLNKRKGKKLRIVNSKKSKVTFKMKFERLVFLIAIAAHNIIGPSASE